MTPKEFLEFKNVGDEHVNIEFVSKLMDEYFQKEIKDIKNEHISQLNDAKIKNSQMLDKMKEMIDTNVAQLEAVKMLFSLMKSGSTHRQKHLFCEQSRNVIDIQISEVKNAKSWLEFNDKFPF